MGILNLIGNVTEREVKINDWKILQIRHPDKYCPDLTGISPNQAEEYYKLVSIVYNFYALMRKG